MNAPFEYIYTICPIDFWSGAQEADCYETEIVLRQMPEEPRDERVYKLYLPDPGSSCIMPVYLCKADNNGTIYVFSHWDIKNLFEDMWG